MNEKKVRLLSIGNSFTASVQGYLPPLAAHEGRELVFANLVIGGCSLARHAENLIKCAEDPSFKPYWMRTFGFAEGDSFSGDRNASVNEALAYGQWDVVTVQQASHESWTYDTYQPHGHSLVEAIRKACPDAEVVIQQTWAYRADDPRIQAGGEWGFDQAGMADRVFASYDKFAADEGIKRQIPTGRAVWISRRRETAPFHPYSKAELAACRWPDLPSQAGDVVGALGWQKNWDTMEMTIGRDSIHLNKRGEYLQALVWFGFLFGVDPVDTTYLPNEIALSDAKFLRLCARDALAQK